MATTKKKSTYDEFEVDALASAKTQSDNYAAERRQMADKSAATSDQSFDRAIDNTTRNYMSSAEETKKNYRGAFDANAVNELVAQRNVQERLNNMGLGTSGYGATQQTAIALQRGRADNAVSMQKQSAIDSIMKELDSKRSQMESDKLSANQSIYERADADILSFKSQADAQARQQAATLYGISREDARATEQMNWQSKENAAARDWQAGQSQIDRDWQAKQSQINRDWEAGQAQLNRDWQSSESAAQRNWQSGENTAARDFEANQAQINRDWQSSESAAQRNWQSGENAANRTHEADMARDNRNWQSSENALNRTHESNESAAARSWQETQNQINRDWEAGQAQLAREHESSENAASRQWQGDQNAYDRDARYAYQQTSGNSGNVIVENEDGGGNPVDDDKIAVYTQDVTKSLITPDQFRASGENSYYRTYENYVFDQIVSYAKANNLSEEQVGAMFFDIQEDLKTKGIDVNLDPKKWGYA